jgi:adenylate kinase
LLRAAVKEKSELGQKAESYMSAGNLVPDELMLGLIEDRLSEPDVGGGFILDGFPRTVRQAEGLDEVLGDRRFRVAGVVDIRVPREQLLARLTGRGRADDTPETAAKRLDVYEESTRPVLGYYDGQGLVGDIDGVGAIEQVFDRICYVVDGWRAAHEARS